MEQFDEVMTLPWPKDPNWHNDDYFALHNFMIEHKKAYRLMYAIKRFYGY